MIEKIKINQHNSVQFRAKQFYQISQTISETSQTSGFVLPLTCSVNNDSGLLHVLFLHEAHVLPKNKNSECY